MLKRFTISIAILLGLCFLIGFSINLSKTNNVARTDIGLSYAEAGYAMSEEFKKLSPNASLDGMIILEENEKGEQIVSTETPAFIADCISARAGDDFICPAEFAEEVISEVTVEEKGQKMIKKVITPGLSFDRDTAKEGNPVTINVIEDGAIVSSWKDYVNSSFEKIDEKCDLTQEVCEIK